MRLLYVLLALLSTAVSLHAQSYQPNLSLSSNSPVCDGQTFQINAARSIPPGGTTLSFRWSGPNSFTCNAFAALQVPASAATAGVYSLTMTYSGTNNGTATASTTLALGTPKPDAYISYISSEGYTIRSPSYQICSPVSLSLIANPDQAGSSNAATYQWSGPGGYSSTERNPVVAQGVAGLYIVEATYPNGCGTGRDTVTISSFTPSVFVGTYLPGQNQQSTSSFCPGSAAEFRASTSTVPAGTTTSYQWSGPNGFTSTAQNFTLTNLTTAMAGSYSVVATFSGTCSTTATRSQSIQVGTPFVGAFSGAANGTSGSSNNTFCPGSSFRVYVSAYPGATYQWRGPNGLTSTAPSFTLTNATPAMSGAYSLTVTFPGGCSGTAVASITIGTPSVFAYSGATNGTTFSNSSTLCAGSDFRVFTSTYPGATYQWSGPNGFTSTAPSFTLTNATPAMSGAYSLTVTLPGGCSGTAVASVMLGTPSVFASSYTVGPAPVYSRNFCPGSAFRLDASSSGTATYQWTGPNGFTSSGQSITLTNATTAMTGIYSVTATFSGACSGTSTGSVYVKIGANTPVVTASGTFTGPNQPITLTASGCDSYDEQTVWSTGAIGSTLLVSPAQSMTYSAVCRLNNGGCSGPSSNVISVTVTNAPPVDLRLSMQLDTRTPDVNRPVVVTVLLENRSNQDATGVQWRCRLPGSLAFTTQEPGVVYLDGVVSSNPVPVAANSILPFSFTVTPTTNATYRLASQITASDNPDPDATPDFGTNSGQKYVAWADFRTSGATTTLVLSSPEPNPARLPPVASNQPIVEYGYTDLSLALETNTLTPRIGEDVLVTVRLSSRGYFFEEPARVHCLLPPGMTFVSSSDFTASGSELISTTRSAYTYQATSFSFRARFATPGAATLQAEIFGATHPDVDSTPNNGYDTGEDDTATVSLRAQ